MSRIGKKPIPIPPGVKVQLDGLTVRAEGPKGKLSQLVPTGLTPKVVDGVLVIERGSEDRRIRAMHGLARALVAESLRAFRDDGMTSAVLGVDAENPTGALGVYESNGFRVHRKGLNYRKPL